MYRNLSLKNFRGFQEINIGPLARINLIAGKNNLGKTAILEAFILHIGPNNAELGLRLNAFRGMEQMPSNPEEIWGWLFYGRKTDQAIIIRSSDEENLTQTLRIELKEPSIKNINTNGKKKPVLLDSEITNSSIPELILHYSDSKGQKGVSRGSVTPEGKISLKSAEISRKTMGILMGSRINTPLLDVQRYSQLEMVGRQDEILESLQVIEPRLKRLAVVVITNLSMINGDIGIGRMIPLPFIGEGTGRLLSILLAISAAPNGVVLIDEIENGLHYSVLKNVWNAIAGYARKSNTQIIASTHSLECIEAAHQAFCKDDIYDFRLHRLDRINDTISTVSYDKETLDASIKAELEVR